VLEVETAEALASDHWLGISSDSVEEFLRMEYLDVREIDLVKALVRWAKFQVDNDGDDPEDGQKLRTKLLPGLKHIRFAALTKVEGKLCLELLGGVLSEEERLSISTNKWQLAARRKKPHQVCHLPQFLNSHSKIWRGSDELLKRSMELQVDKRAELVGLNFEATRNFREWQKALNFQLMDSHNGRIAGGNFRREISHDGVNFAKVTPKCVLEAGVKYTLEFTYCGPGDRPLAYQNYLLMYGTAVTAGWLSLQIGSNVNFIESKGMSLLFVKP
jgi:hypothetical protein